MIMEEIVLPKYCVIPWLTHAKGDGGYNNLQDPGSPLILHLDALFGRHARMVVASRNLPFVLHARLDILRKAGSAHGLAALQHMSYSSVARG